MDKNIQFIAGGLAVFFLVVAIIKSAISKAQKRKLANKRAAEANGGTEESPVQFYDPFAEEQAKTAAAQTAQPPVANATTAEADEPKATDIYKWN